MSDLPGGAGPSVSPSPTRALLALAAALFALAGSIAAYTLLVRPPAPAVSDVPAGTEEPAGPWPAPPFALPSLRGPDRIALADFRGRVVVLNFFASWCRPCALEAATLERAWQATRTQGVVFLGVAVQDRYADARAFLDAHGVTYPAVFDDRGDLMLAYRVVGIPTTFFVSPAALVTGQHAGIFVGDEGLGRLLERVARARQVAE